MVERTVLVIAHRLSTVRNASKVKREGVMDITLPVLLCILSFGFKSLKLTGSPKLTGQL